MPSFSYGTIFDARPSATGAGPPIRHTDGMNRPPKKTLKYCTAFLAVSLLLQGCAAYVATSGRVAVREDRAGIASGFSSRDRISIEEHFHHQRVAPSREALPSGFAPRSRLPAGIQGRPLPRALEAKLTVLPFAYLRLQVGRDVLLLERESRIVLDLLRDVLPE